MPETDLVQQYQRTRDPIVGDRLLREHDQWLKRQARRASFKLHIDRDEALQAVRIGFLQAVEHFDPAVGSSLHAYAAAGYIRKQLAEVRAEHQTPLLPVGLHTIARLRELHRAVRAIEATGQPVTDEAIAAHTGWGMEHVTALRGAESCRSLDEVVTEDGHSRVDLIVSDTERPDEAAERRSDLAALRATLDSALDQLPPRRAEIVRLWLAHGCEMGAQVVVAEKLGVRRQTVSLAISKAMTDLRGILVAQPD
jgi:RNA polymerase sigma factor (sigma-70 family)